MTELPVVVMPESPKFTAVGWASWADDIQSSARYDTSTIGCFAAVAYDNRCYYQIIVGELASNFHQG